MVDERIADVKRIAKKGSTPQLQATLKKRLIPWEREIIANELRKRGIKVRSTPVRRETLDQKIRRLGFGF